jgi:hypothetical protein
VARDSFGFADLLGLGLAVGVLLALGIAAGWWLDRLMHTSPALVLVGIALGIAGGICYTVVRIRPFLKE